MPGIVKIGKTTRDVPTRASELFQTGVPMPFEVAGYVYSPDCHILEARCHANLGRRRVEAGREFFRAPAEYALRVLTDEHRLHMEEIVDAYLPDHLPAPEDDFFDTSKLRASAEEVGAAFEKVKSAIEQFSAEDLRMLQIGLGRGKPEVGADV